MLQNSRDLLLFSMFLLATQSVCEQIRFSCQDNTDISRSVVCFAA